MSFRTESIGQVRLHSLEETADWISDTQKFLVRIPVMGVVEQGAVFRDDEYFGDDEVFFHFNQPGFTAFCKRLGCRQDFLERIKTPVLATQVLNDLLFQQDVRNELDGDEFVIDERSNTILGLVSKSYVTYSNHDLLVDIKKRIDKLPAEHGFRFQEAYGINTGLTVRYVSIHEEASVKVRSGRGDDRSKLGLEFSNSMVGTSAVRLNYYLYRLICTNGMMVPAAESINRIYHAGRVESFESRMDRRFNEVVRNLEQLREMLSTLGGLIFDPKKLACHRALTDQIFSVIPGIKQELCTKDGLFLRYAEDATNAQREESQRAHDARLIALIPNHLGGEHSTTVFRFRDTCTVFDFVNVFTEFAKTQAPNEKLRIEERSGSLAKYIAKNATKL